MLPEDVVNGIKADAKIILHETGCLVGCPDTVTIAKKYQCSDQTVHNVLSGKVRRCP
ncbi:hypothetical protein JG687_00014965 [Phytophthora cactorum]|uniref:Uncharacterized protein n=1 Tax=Phytophthora cactorum TaxID=29920 RepID=A0A8T1U055_9STRA|nr:hypothetical protein JG687_00014965 [Phytophthora cactorum]